MKNWRLRALVLSAGFGTRLRPLTFLAPKPLLPVCGEPIVGWTLRRLGRVGCELAVLNTHHLAEKIPDYLGRAYWGLPLRYSLEPEIMGTYGALHGPRSLLADADAVLMINGDSLCHWPLESLVRHHFKTESDVTLLLHRRAPQDALGGGIGVDAEGRVSRFRDYPGRGEVRRRHVFAGVHVLSPKVLERVEHQSGDIISLLYQPMLEEGARISSRVTGRRWHDLGTPSRYLAANLDWARGSWPRSLWPRGVISPLARIDAGAHVHRSIVDEDATVSAGASVRDSLIMEGAVVGEGCRVQHSIVGPGVLLAESSNVEKRMVSRMDKRHRLGSQESVMGDWLYTPLSDPR